MGIDCCRMGPCPVIKTSSQRLNPQPYRCYNCQHRLSRIMTAPTPARDASCVSSLGSLDSGASRSSASSNDVSMLPKLTRAMTDMSHPLPGVAKQPKGIVQYSHNYNRSASSAGKPFNFSCSGSGHYPTPHYATLPTFLPHQDHPCPPCQLEDLRRRADREVAIQATQEFPHLRSEMLVRNGRIQEDILQKLTLAAYVEEKREDERQMWLHVTRKWTQDLKNAKVLVAEEDGLGLLCS